MFLGLQPKNIASVKENDCPLWTNGNMWLWPMKNASMPVPKKILINTLCLGMRNPKLI